MISSFSRRLPVLFLCLMVTACSSLTVSQQKATKTYARATTTLGQFGETEFTGLRSGIISMNQMRFVLRKDQGMQQADFYITAGLNDVNARVTAARALASYGELLQSLLSKDVSDDLDDAAATFADNAASALGDEFGDDKKSAIQTLVEGLGSFWVERERGKALKAIITDYQPTVKQLVQLLENDLTLDGKSGMMRAYLSAARALKNESYTIVNAGDEYSYADRNIAAAALLQAMQAQEHVDEIVPRASQALQALRQSNDALVRVLDDKNYATGDIKEYAKQIRDLVKVYNALSA